MQTIKVQFAIFIAFTSIVEFASQEDSQRAIRELSETPLLGRPVFIREVRSIPDQFENEFLTNVTCRIARPNRDLVLHLSQVK